MPPGADFANVTPHGRRRQKKPKFRSRQSQSDGSYTVGELPGPASFDDERACFKVLRVVPFLLKAVAIERPEAYNEFTKMSHKRYSERNAYPGDVRMRSEELERTRREAARVKSKGWDPP